MLSNGFSFKIQFFFFEVCGCVACGCVVREESERAKERGGWGEKKLGERERV